MDVAKISIAPGATDSNKGDQALVVASITLTKRLFPSAEIGVISTSPSDLTEDTGEMRHTKHLGIETLCSILPSPEY